MKEISIDIEELGGIKVTRHSDLMECLSLYHGRSISELLDADEALSELFYIEDTPIALTISELVDIANKQGFWGFCGDDEIHLWFNEKTDVLEIAELIGHELGHRIRPLHRTTVKEEQKAQGYGLISRLTVLILMDVWCKE